MSEKERDDLIFELINRRYDSEHARTNNLDSKANSLIGFTSIVVGLILGAGTMDILKLLHAQSAIVIYFIGIATLLLSIGFSLWSFRVRSWIMVPKVQTLIEKYTTKSYDEVLKRNAGEMAKAVAFSEVQNNNKAKLIEYSWYCLLIGLTLIFIFMLFYILIQKV
jgi:hypothetical protein